MVFLYYISAYCKSLNYPAQGKLRLSPLKLNDTPLTKQLEELKEAPKHETTNKTNKGSGNQNLLPFHYTNSKDSRHVRSNFPFKRKE